MAITLVSALQTCASWASSASIMSRWLFDSTIRTLGVGWLLKTCTASNQESSLLQELNNDSAVLKSKVN